MTRDEGGGRAHRRGWRATAARARRVVAVGALGLGATLASVGCTDILGKLSVGAGGAGGSAATSSSSSGSGGATSSSASSSSGSGGATSSSGGSGGTGTSSSSSSGSSSSGAPPLPCSIDHLLISEIRSRGENGSYDDFVELYNPTLAPVVLSSSWAIKARTADSSTIDYTVRWQGAGETIPARGHFLIAGATYADGTEPDAALASSFADAAGVILVKGATVVDAVCFYSTFDQLTALIDPFTAHPYTCKGAPVSNPHDNTAATNMNKSIERKPGGEAGNCTDTGDNDDDFITKSPSTPANTQSPPAP